MKKYKRRRHSNLSKAQVAYVCTQLDFIMKRYLMDIFGAELKKAHVSLGDCYSAEKWTERIHARLSSRRELVKKIIQRGYV